MTCPASLLTGDERAQQRKERVVDDESAQDGHRDNGDESPHCGWDVNGVGQQERGRQTADHHYELHHSQRSQSQDLAKQQGAGAEVVKQHLDDPGRFLLDHTHQRELPKNLWQGERCHESKEGHGCDKFV